MIGTAPSVSCAVSLGIKRVWIHYFQLVFLHTEVFAHKPRIPASSLKVLEACEEHSKNVGAGLPTPSRAGSASAPPMAPAPARSRPRPLPRLAHGPALPLEPGSLDRTGEVTGPPNLITQAVSELVSRNPLL